MPLRHFSDRRKSYDWIKRRATTEEGAKARWREALAKNFLSSRELRAIAPSRPLSIRIALQKPRRGNQLFALPEDVANLLWQSQCRVARDDQLSAVGNLK